MSRRKFEEIAKAAEDAVREMHIALNDEASKMGRQTLAEAFSHVADVTNDLALTVEALRTRLEEQHGFAGAPGDHQAELAYYNLQSAEMFLGDCYKEAKP